ncbi:MAG: SsrA-binding protein [Myxococcota bacterium]|jgi:SsrA-binding protein
MAKTKKKKPGESADGTKLVAQNRRARFDYHLEDRFEAGIMLTGTEVKSLRDGKASLVESWVKVDHDGEAWLMQANIAEYDHGNRNNHDPTRERKLLLHRLEIDRLGKLVATKGVSLIPTRLYFKAGRAKLEFAVAKGKDAADKRQASKEKTAKREIETALKNRR